MSPKDKEPGKKGRIYSFPQKEGRIPGEADEADLLGAWQVELADLAEEEPGRRCRLSLEPEPGRILIGFLEATGIKSLVLVTKAKGRLTISADKATITRLVVWRALDLGLDFKVEFDD